jgi:hypothetical protein
MVEFPGKETARDERGWHSLTVEGGQLRCVV